jgi:hypothetical protein
MKTTLSILCALLGASLAIAANTKVYQAAVVPKGAALLIKPRAVAAVVASPVPPTNILLTATMGAKWIFQQSPDLVNWTSFQTSCVPSLTFSVPATNPTQFYRSITTTTTGTALYTNLAVTNAP